MSEKDSKPTPRTHEQVLADAVRVLTEAARLTRPVLEHDIAASDTAGQPVWVESGKREPVDWAEFVTLTLAGAAANVGGVEAVLAGRPGSWETDGVRQLLLGTVGPDDEYLLGHRTEPVVVEVFVDEVLNDLGAWERHEAAIAVLSLREAALDPSAADYEAQLDAIAVAEERLDEERAAAWAAYGEALRTAVEAAAARRPGLRVPVQVTVDLDTFRPFEDRGDDWGLVAQLVQEAIEATPPPPAPILPPVPTTGPGDGAGG